MNSDQAQKSLLLWRVFIEILVGMKKYSVSTFLARSEREAIAALI